MLTLKKLAVATPRPIQLRALMQCRVHITRAVEDVDDFGNHVKECAGLVRATDGDRYVMLIFYEPDRENLTDSKIWAHCSCPYYTFNVETVNALKKSSDVINSNGELPVIRNPRMIPHLCKHLLALAKYAVKAKFKHVKKRTIKTRTEEPETKVPPAKVLRRPGERAEQPGLKRPPAGPKAGPKPPAPGVKPLAGPKPVKPVGGGPRRPR